MCFPVISTQHAKNVNQGNFVFGDFSKCRFALQRWKIFFNIYYHQPVLQVFLQPTEIQVCTCFSTGVRKAKSNFLNLKVFCARTCPFAGFSSWIAKKREVRYIFGSFFCHLWIVPMDWNIATPLKSMGLFAVHMFSTILVYLPDNPYRFLSPPKCPKGLQAWQAFYLCLLFGVIRSIHWKM